VDKHTSSNNIQPIKEPHLAPAQEVKGLRTRVELIQMGLVLSNKLTDCTVTSLNIRCYGNKIN